MNYFELAADTVVSVLNDADVEIWYRPHGLQPIRIEGVFDARAKDVKFDDGIPVTDQRPALLVREKDLLRVGITATDGDKVTIAGVDYQVADTNPDSFGGLKLMLNQLVAPA